MTHYKILSTTFYLINQIKDKKLQLGWSTQELVPRHCEYEIIINSHYSCYQIKPKPMCFTVPINMKYIQVITMNQICINNWYVACHLHDILLRYSSSTFKLYPHNYTHENISKLAAPLFRDNMANKNCLQDTL